MPLQQGCQSLSGGVKSGGGGLTRVAKISRYNQFCRSYTNIFGDVTFINCYVKLAVIVATGQCNHKGYSQDIKELTAVKMDVSGV